MEVWGEIKTNEYEPEYYVAGINMHDGLFSVGGSVLYNKGVCSGSYDCRTKIGRGVCVIPFYIRDKFEDPLDLFNLIPGKFDFGTVYGIHADWSEVKNVRF